MNNKEYFLIKNNGNYSIISEQNNFGSRIRKEEFIYFNKPTLAQIKNDVISDINNQIDEKILNGFEWNILHGEDSGKTVNVWLSEENQRNYSEALRLAMLTTGGNVLPITFKISEINGRAIYETFQTLEELNNFYFGVFEYIKNCLLEGWQMKDNFDWTPFEEILNQE